MRNKLQSALVLVFILALLALPFWFADRSGGASHVFGGFLFNPLDGNSYLAKMRLGWEGEWKFTPLYSPEPGEGAYLFLFYVALGHLARLANAPLIGVFHAARLAASAWLVFTLWRFAQWYFEGDRRLAGRAWFLMVFGSGLGWLVSLATGYLTGDFWIAETFPFLSMIANPHFPLGLALMLWIGLYHFQERRGRYWVLPLLSVALGIVQPFGVVAAAVMIGAHGLVHWRGLRLRQFASGAAGILPGAAFLLYQFLAIQADAVLAGWNLQNLTPAPAVWDALLTLSPALLFAVAGVAWGWRSGNARLRTTVVWLALGLVLVYTPFPLQRRFMTGLYVPAALAAVSGATAIASRLKKSRWVWPALALASVLTNVLLFAAFIPAILRKDPALYLTAAEAQALRWVAETVPPGEVMLAGPEVGSFAPGWTGMRVVYGHPFESIQAEATLAGVEDIYAGRLSTQEQDDFLGQYHVRLIFVGPRERSLGDAAWAAAYPRVYDEGGVQLYTVPWTE